MGMGTDTMSTLLTRRKLLTGLIAAPLVIKVELLMPLRGITMPTILRTTMAQVSWQSIPSPALLELHDWTERLRRQLTELFEIPPEFIR